jgi:hypothetical protein
MRMARTPGTDQRMPRGRRRGEALRAGNRSRIAINVDAVHREVDPAYASPGVVELFRQMAALKAGR